VIQRYFIYTNGPRIGEKVVLSADGQISIGRGPTNNIVLNEKKVSRFHAVVTQDDLGDCYIEDLQSTNGVYVNDNRITERTLLRSGDKVQIGRNLFSFIVDDVMDAPSADIPKGGRTEIHDIASEGCILSGRIEELGLADLLQTLNRNKKSGKLVIQVGDSGGPKQTVGSIEIKQGNPVYAETVQVKGEKALYRLFRISKGYFNFLMLTEANYTSGLGQLDQTLSLENILLEAYRQIDEIKKLEGAFPNSDLTFDLNHKADLPLGDLKPEMLPLFQAILSRRSFQEILDSSPLTDLETMQLMYDLLQKQLIKKAS
jgi:pSer/pThr/pTyr-binding forkhead associated (FHA) protein